MRLWHFFEVISRVIAYKLPTKRVHASIAFGHQPRPIIRDDGRAGLNPLSGVMIEAFNIIQDKIIRSRMAGDPPDMIIRPKLSDIGLSDFHRAAEAIEFGYETTRIQLEALEESNFAAVI